MRIYDCTEVADLLRVSVKSVRMYLRCGSLQGRKVAGHWLIPEQALAAFLLYDRSNAAAAHPCPDDQQPRPHAAQAGQRT